MSKKIREFEENDKVFGSYLVTNVVKGVTANSRNYMTITLQDDSGSIEGKKWDSDKEDEEVFAIGNVVSINADVILYKTSLQLKIYNGEVVPMNLVDISRFLIMAPESLESLTSQINEYVSSFKNKDLKVNVVTVQNPDLVAILVAQSIAEQLEKRQSFRTAQKKAIQRVMKAGAKGIKTEVSGRLGGTDIARSEGYSEGIVPLHTLRSDIDYAVAEAHTTYGRLGVKVWICRGEIIPTKETKADSSTEKKGE